MTADQFKAWLAEMKSTGIAATDTACAKALGLHVNTMLLMKDRGADKRTALACAALLRRILPYGEAEA